MKKISAYEIALSALACAVSTVFLVLGTITPVLLFTGYLASCIALMLPLSKGSYRGYVLAYLGTGFLSFLFCGSAFLPELLGFVCFFGLHPLFNELQLRFQMKRWLAFLIKAVWFDGAMYLIWRFVFDMTTSVAFVDTFIIPFILVVGTGFFALYDYTMFLCRGKILCLVNRLIKK